MATRTTVGKVRALGNWSVSTDLLGFVESASALVDKVADCAGDELNATQLELIERWLAAHFYAVTSPGVTSKSVGGASKSFHTGQLGMGLEYTPFGQQALALDTSGCLDKLTSDKVQLTWLGTNETEYDADWNE